MSMKIVLLLVIAATGYSANTAHIRHRQTQGVCAVDCHAHGSCVDGECKCDDGYDGDGVWRCADIDECAANDPPCTEPGMYCVNHFPPVKYECGCVQGYSAVLPVGYTDPDVPIRLRPQSCEDIDQCADPALNRCDEVATCTDLMGNYECECPAGYLGDGYACTPTAPPIDVCDAAGCDADSSKCTIDADDSVWCDCVDGYYAPSGRGGACHDIDECAEIIDDCGGNTECINTPGSYLCNCTLDGYNSDGVGCVDIDECASETVNCGEGTYCTNVPGSYECTPITDQPSTVPSDLPSLVPSTAPSKIAHCGAEGDQCGTETAFGCSCNNDCGTSGTCCWDYVEACADYGGFTTATFEIVYTGADEVSAALKAGEVELMKGSSSGCGFTSTFSTIGTLYLTQCLLLNVAVLDDFSDSSQLTAYLNGVKVLSLSGAGSTAGNYELDCSMFDAR